MPHLTIASNRGRRRRAKRSRRGNPAMIGGSIGIYGEGNHIISYAKQDLKFARQQLDKAIVQFNGGKYRDSKSTLTGVVSSINMVTSKIIR